MALPALKETFESLSIETRRRASPTTHASDVVSFTIGQIIKVVDGVVEGQQHLRGLFIRVNRCLQHAIDDANDLEECADLLELMKRTRQEVSRSFLAQADGQSGLAEITGALRSFQSARPADGRVGRRQAKRIDDIVELLEAQRLKFMSSTRHAIDFLEVKFSGNLDFDRAYKKAITEQSIKQYPVMNEYLAR